MMIREILEKFGIDWDIADDMYTQEVEEDFTTCEELDRDFVAGRKLSEDEFKIYAFRSDNAELLVDFNDDLQSVYYVHEINGRGVGGMYDKWGMMTRIIG